MATIDRWLAFSDSTTFCNRVRTPNLYGYLRGLGERNHPSVRARHIYWSLGETLFVAKFPMLPTLVPPVLMKRGPYRPFHPLVKVLAQTGQVPAEIKREIPASTWHDWRRRDHTHAIGSDLVGLIQQDAPVLNAYLSHAAFRKIVHASYRLLLTIGFIVGKIPGARKAIKCAKQKIASLISRDGATLGLKAMTRAFGISIQTFYRWRRSIPCPSSLKNLCRRLHPAQLTKDEVTVVRDALLAPEKQHWPLAAHFYDMLRQGKAFMSLSTFYDYAKVLGLSRCLPANRRKKHLVGIRAGKSGELLHMDSMVFHPLDHLQVYIHLVMDNFSRFILAHSVHEKLTATNTLATLESALEDHHAVLCPLEPNLLMTDGGSENNLVPFARVRHLIAQRDISASNSMVEATNKSVKYRGLFCLPLADFNAVVTFLPRAIDDYNHRPHTALFGLTPHEVFHGAIPDRRRYRAKIAQAVRNRLTENMKTYCRPEETPPCE